MELMLKVQSSSDERTVGEREPLMRSSETEDILLSFSDLLAGVSEGLAAKIHGEAEVTLEVSGELRYKSSAEGKILGLLSVGGHREDGKNFRISVKTNSNAMKLGS